MQQLDTTENYYIIVNTIYNNVTAGEDGRGCPEQGYRDELTTL